MRLAAWLLALPVILVVTVFAVANRQEIRFDLWPLPFSADLPAYLAVLAPLGLGLVTGALLAWLPGLGRRLKSRQDRARIESLERQLAAASRSEPT
jgi:uncharacterized integral membrane protein